MLYENEKVNTKTRRLIHFTLMSPSTHFIDLYIYNVYMLPNSFFQCFRNGIESPFFSRQNIPSYLNRNLSQWKMKSWWGIYIPFCHFENITTLYRLPCSNRGNTELSNEHVTYVICAVTLQVNCWYVKFSTFEILFFFSLKICEKRGNMKWMYIICSWKIWICTVFG